MRAPREKQPKPIRFSRHAVENMRRRGTTAVEVSQTITEASWVPARAGRFECVKDFLYNDYWNGKLYRTKQVVPIFKEEGNNIVVITVYVFYF